MQKFLFIMLSALLMFSTAGCRSNKETDIARSKNTNLATVSEKDIAESSSDVLPPYCAVTNQDKTASPSVSSEHTEKQNISSTPVKPPSDTSSNPAVSSPSSAVPNPPSLSSDTSSDKNVLSNPEFGKTEPPAETNPYSYPFDIDAIKKDLMNYGESLGMKHRTHYSDGTIISQDNGSYELPVYISKDSTAWVIKKALYEQLDYYYNAYHAEFFTIYIEAYDDSEYQIYSIYA